MRKFLVACLVVALGWVASTGAQEAAKYSIKDVMQKAHKGGLMKKVADGKATAEEKKQLVEYYEALAANKPPKGDEASWKEKTAELLAAAKDAAAGNLDKLKAINCGACHKAHK